MQITSIHSKNIFSNLSFQASLQHKLSKNLYTKSELIEMIDNADEKDKFLGSLPPSWIQDLPPEEIGVKTKEAFNVFCEFAESVYKLEDNRCDILEKKMRKLEQELAQMQNKQVPGDIFEQKWEEYRKCVEKITSKFEGEDYDPDCNKLASKLSDLLNKTIEVKYLDDGARGITFKISAGDEQFALKTYKPLRCKPFCHGQTIEPAAAIYLNRIMKPERCTKFYCGKIASDDEHDGFMLTRYIESASYDEEKIRTAYKWIKNADMLSNRFKFTDVKPSDPFNGNFINGTLVDFGGIEFTCKSAKEYKLMKQLHQAIKSGDTDTIRQIKEEHSGSKEFENCIKRIFSYLKLFSNQDFVAIHDEYSEPTDKMIKSFKELGMNIQRD